jgi:hypothetical protein
MCAEEKPHLTIHVSCTLANDVGDVLAMATIKTQMRLSKGTHCPRFAPATPALTHTTFNLSRHPPPPPPTQPPRGGVWWGVGPHDIPPDEVAGQDHPQGGKGAARQHFVVLTCSLQQR